MQRRNQSRLCLVYSPIHLTVLKGQHNIGGGVNHRLNARATNRAPTGRHNKTDSCATPSVFIFMRWCPTGVYTPACDIPRLRRF